MTTLTTTKKSEIHSYDQMRKIIVNLGSKKPQNNNISKCQLNHLHNLLLMIIVDTPEKGVSNVDRKLYKINIRKSSINSSSPSYFS